MVDNGTPREICCYDVDTEHPTYTKLKQPIGQMVSSSTAIPHFDGSFNVDLVAFQTILAPLFPHPLSHDDRFTHCLS